MTDFAKLVLDADTRGLKRGQRELDKTGDGAKRAASRVDQSAMAITKSFARVGVAFAGAFAASGALRQVISTNAEFGASIQRVAAISGATGAELDKLRQSALDMGAATQFSASQAADALGFLAMAGFSASEAVAAIPSVLDLAAASGMELAQAADIASNVLSGFGKEASQAGEVADVLAKAASSTNTSVGQLGRAMSTAAPIAKALGVSMQETASAIGVMSDAGIQGERAGTALRGVFASLAGPTKQAQQALAKYGLTARDIDPQLVGLSGAMKALGDANISTADAMIIFGREAASGALVMADTAERMASLTREFENADGAAAKMAETMRDNLQGDIDQMKSALESATIALGDSGLTGGFRSAAQAATTALRSIAENMNTLVTAVGALTVAWVSYRGTLLATSALTTIFTSRLAIQTAAVLSSARAVGGLTAAKLTLGAAVTGVTGGLRMLTAALIANPFTAVAVAVGTLASAMFLLRDSQRQARAETDNLIRSLRSLAQARSSEFAATRTNVQMQLNRARDLLGAVEGDINVPQARIQQLRWEVVRLEGELTAADLAFKGANESAEAMAAPVVGATGAVSDLSDAVVKAGGSARAVSDDFADLMESLYPENITRRQMQQLRLIDRMADSIDNVTDARRRALRLPQNDNPISRDLLSTSPLMEAEKVEVAAKRITDAFDKQVKRAGDQSVVIRRTFREMAQDVTNSLQGLASSIQGGNFFDILSSVLDLLLQLGSTGLFGKGIARNINSPVDGTRADGGSVAAGRTYLVGERGPELFTPPSHGRIHSNDNMGGKLDVTITMDESTGQMGAFVRNQAGQIVAEAAPAIISAGGRSGVAQMNKLQQRRLG